MAGCDDPGGSDMTAKPESVESGLYEWLAPKLSTEERKALDGIMARHRAELAEALKSVPPVTEYRQDEHGRSPLEVRLVNHELALRRRKHGVDK